MKRYLGKLHGKSVKVYGQSISIHQGRVSENIHDSELRQPNRRHHVFFDADLELENGLPNCVWVEVWFLYPRKRPDFSRYDVKWWGKYPSVAEVLTGIAQVIEKNIEEKAFETWLKEMRPVRKQRKERVR